MVFSPDSRYILTGSYDGTARLWDTINIAAEPLVLQGHTIAIMLVAFSKNSKYALTVSLDKTVRSWDLEHRIKDLDLEQLIAVLAAPQHK